MYILLFFLLEFSSKVVSFEHSPLVECAMRFTKFYRHGAAFYGFTSMGLDVAHDENSTWVAYNKFDKDFKNLTRFDYYVLEGTFEAVKSVLALLQESPRFKPVVDLLVVLSGRPDLGDVFFWFHKSFFFNVVVITEDLDVYTYYTFIGQRCVPPKPTFLFSCSNIHKNSKVFKSQHSLYFKGCKIDMYTLKVPPYVGKESFDKNTGFEVRQVREAVRMMRLTPKDVDHSFDNWGEKLPNGSFTKILAKLHEHDADIMFGNIGLQESFLFDFDYYTHGTTSFLFFVPLPKQLDPWKNLVQVFEWDVWLALGVLLLVIPPFWYITADTKVTWVHSYISVFRILVSTIEAFPQLAKARILFLSWVITVFILINAYQGFLTSVLFIPAFEKQLASNDELVMSKLPFGGYKTAVSRFKKTLLPIAKTKYEECSFSGETCFHRMYVEQNFAFLKSTRSILYLIKKKKVNFYVLPPLFSIFDTMYFPKGSPYFRRMTLIFAWIKEAGLMKKWDMYSRMPKREPPPKKPSAITFDHVKLLLLIFLVGLGVAFFSFLVEVYGSWRQKRQQKFPFNP